MTLASAIALIVAAATLVYLLVTLLRPEKY